MMSVLDSLLYHGRFTPSVVRALKTIQFFEVPVENIFALGGQRKCKPLKLEKSRECFIVQLLTGLCNSSKSMFTFSLLSLSRLGNCLVHILKTQ